MKTGLGCEELYLMELLKKSLLQEDGTGPAAESFRRRSQKLGDTEHSINWARVMELAKSHAVLPLLYDVCKAEGTIPDAQWMLLERFSVQMVRQSYHLLFLTRDILNLFQEHGISCIPLKGVVTAAFYPVPELRKSGDIDLLLLNEEDAKRGILLLKEVGFQRREEQNANHHLVCTSPEGIDAELHIMLAEPFDNERINGYLTQILPDFFANTSLQEVMGVTLPVLQVPYHAFYLLVHMLQHFLRAGFGLKLLCDWTVLFAGGMKKEDQHVFLELLRESGILGFAQMVTAACVSYLGLSADRVSFLQRDRGFEESIVEEFMREIFEAEEFGKSASDRMVALRGTKPFDYIREFHHQMRLIYPKAGKIALFWPVLWGMTLAGFLYRNYRIRRVSFFAVLRKAGKRSRLMERIQLFLWK